MYAFLLSTAVIFVAELGDKSQLMAMTFATRYRARDVLLGITAAAGTIDVGKLANLVVVSGNDLFANVPVKHVFVEGRLY